MAYEVTRFRTWSIQVTWKLDGVPVDITGYTIKSDFRLDRSSPVVTSLSTTNGGISLTTPASGVFTMTMTPSQTAQLPLGGLLFDVLALSPGGVGTTVLEGSITIQEPITKT